VSIITGHVAPFDAIIATSYQLEQETIARKNAESLVAQFKQQLSKLEQRLLK